MEQLSGGEMIIRALEDEGVEYIFGTQVVPHFIFTTPFSRRIQYPIFWCVMSRRQRTRPMAMRARPESLAWCL